MPQTAAEAGSLRVVIRNLGPDPAPTAHWQVQLPTQIDVLAADSDRAVCTLVAPDHSVLCEADALDVAEEVEVELQIEPRQDGAFSWTVSTADSPGYDPQSGNDSATSTLTVYARADPPPDTGGGGGAGGGGGGGAAALVALTLLGKLRRTRPTTHGYRSASSK
jgi:Domain of unknown function DUF11